jgi:hypothetical protein
LRVANQGEVADTGLPFPPENLPRLPRPKHFPLMDRTPSKPMAALWMAGWLALMLMIAVAGRETTRELNVFEVMEARSILGLLMLSPLIHVNGGLAAMRTSMPSLRSSP